MGGGLRWDGMASATTINIGTLVLDFVRSIHETTGLDGKRHENNRPKFEPGKESEESEQGHAEAVEKLSSEAEIATEKVSASQVPIPYNGRRRVQLSVALLGPFSLS